MIEALAERRPGELKDVWEEAYDRGPHWRKFLLEGMRNLAPHARDLMLRILGVSEVIAAGEGPVFTLGTSAFSFKPALITIQGFTIMNGHHLGAPASVAASKFARVHTCTWPTA